MKFRKKHPHQVKPISSDASSKEGVTSRLGRNFSINSFGTIIGLFVSFVTVPIYINQIGDARYGILSIIWLLLGYLGFLDLGLSRAATNALARISDTALEERTRIVATSVVLNLMLGAFGGLLLYLCGSFFLERAVSVPTELRPEIEGNLPWVASLLPLALVSGVAVGTLEARERFVAANVLQVIGSSAGQIVPVLCAITFSPTLSVVIPAAVITRALSVVVTCVFVMLFNGPWLIAAPRISTARNLLNYGGWVTVTSLVSPVLQSIDQLIISAIIGVSAVTYYAVPMNLVIRSQLFAVALSRTVFPRMSRVNPVEGLQISEKSFVTLAYGYAALCAPAILFTGSFLDLWLGPKFAEIGAPVARILLLGGWINGLAFIPFSLLQAQSRPDLPAKFHLMEIVPFVVVLWALSSKFGLEGAAFAWSLRAVGDAGLLFYACRMSRTALEAVIPALVVMALSFAVASFVSFTLISAFAAACVSGVSVVILAAIYSPLSSWIHGRSP